MSGSIDASSSAVEDATRLGPGRTGVAPGRSDQWHAWIEACYPSLPRSGKRVAEVFLADPWGAIGMSISTLARIADVSQPCVIRFCRDVGYAGFADFKLAATVRLAHERGGGPAPLRLADSRRGIATDTLIGAMRMIQQLHVDLDEAALRRAVRLLDVAIRIYCLGCDCSEPMLSVVCSQLQASGLPALMIRPPAPGAGHRWVQEGDVMLLLASGRVDDAMADLARAATSAGGQLIILSQGRLLALDAWTAGAGDGPTDVTPPMRGWILNSLVLEALVGGVQARRAVLARQVTAIDKATEAGVPGALMPDRSLDPNNGTSRGRSRATASSPARRRRPSAHPSTLAP